MTRVSYPITFGLVKSISTLYGFWMPKKSTSADVARRARVSRTAVSLVLNGSKSARISEETRQRILLAAKELQYTPDASGRSLVRGRTETIGLILRDLNLLDIDPYLPPLLNGILQRSRAEGYRVLVESASSRDSGDPFAALMDSGRIDGMILENPDFGDAAVRRLILSGRPVVVLGSQGLSEEFSVSLDDRRAGYAATRHLVEIGRRQIAHIAYASAGIFAVEERLLGYLDAMREAGLVVDRSLILHAAFSSESGYEAMLKLLREPAQQPDAVFASSDAVALGAMAALQDYGLRIPQDVAVVGMDDIGAARFCRPTLSTVSSHPFPVGQAAADMLIDLMSGQRPAERRRVVEADLIVRGSTLEGYDMSRLEIVRATTPEPAKVTSGRPEAGVAAPIVPHPDPTST